MRSRSSPRSIPCSLIIASQVLGVASGLGQVDPSENDPPPRNIPVEEKEWDELSSQTTSELGKMALALGRDKWRHAETSNFILHFRRITEARKVAREIEFNIWFVAQTLDVPEDRHSGKSHVYIFEDEQEWREFARSADLPHWSASIAYGDELFLDVRSRGSSRRFDSNTLAHEATHAVVARLFAERFWPLWLNEGFAEFIASAGVAARKNQTIGRHLEELPMARLSLDELSAITTYPEDPMEIGAFYQSGEKFVRLLMLEFPEEKFPAFVDAYLGGGSLESAIMETYGDQVENFEEFEKMYKEYSG